jgi:dipeptidyl aminopeptidase/acylaminoacyl peptidase
MDAARAESLYVSTRPGDHPAGNYARDMAFKARTDSVFRVRSRGVMDLQKISYRSKVGDLDIPAYLWQPIRKRGARGHAAMIWVHGGVHGNVDVGFVPFVRDAVERGYVIIAPEYRGSTGYGSDFHNAIDYGGYEVDDVMTAYDWLVANLPHVDPDRVGMMGWSHGGFITLHSVLRDQHPFKAAAAIVPVTNLVFRLSFKGPGYQRYFATQARLRALPFEQPDLYIERSPLYQVPKLQIPLLVHVATNDEDVDFVEDQQLVWALRAQKPDLAETRVYVDPPGGHSFTHQLNRNLDITGTPEQRDSWNRTWAFFEWILRPYEDRPLR